MILRTRCHLQPPADQERTQLRHQLLPGIAGASHPAAQVTAEADLVTGGVDTSWLQVAQNDEAVSNRSGAGCRQIESGDG
jgi:hypothetical protein